MVAQGSAEFAGVVWNLSLQMNSEEQELAVMANVSEKQIFTQLAAMSGLDVSALAFALNDKKFKYQLVLTRFSMDACPKEEPSSSDVKKNTKSSKKKKKKKEEELGFFMQSEEYHSVNVGPYDSFQRTHSKSWQGVPNPSSDEYATTVASREAGFDITKGKPKRHVTGKSTPEVEVVDEESLVQTQTSAETSTGVTFGEGAGDATCGTSYGMKATAKCLVLATCMMPLIVRVLCRSSVTTNRTNLFLNSW
jgi:hypothetical protein